MKQGDLSTSFIIKSDKDSNHTAISGYASVFNVIDKHNDQLLKGAFANSTADKVKLLWQHDPCKPIGVIKYLAEDEYGLKIEAEINHLLEDGKKVAGLVKQKAINGLSIGFIIKSYSHNNQGTRLISSVELMEISIVTFPANNSANIQEVKNFNTKDINLIDETILNNLVISVNQLSNFF